MNRRTFLATIAGGLLAAALAAEAQPGKKVYRIGFLDFISPDVGHAYSKALNADCVPEPSWSRPSLVS